MKLSVKEFGAYIKPPVSRQAVNNAVVRGHIVRGQDKKIDTEHPINAAWLRSRKTGNHRPKPTGFGKPLAAPEPEPALDAETLLLRISEGNLREVPKLELDKMHKLETLLKVRVEREAKRGELIDRSLVSSVFGKLYTVDSNELKTLGIKLSPDLSAIFEADDPEKILAAEKRIDDEIMKVLSHIKRIMDDALGAWPVAQ